LKNDLLVLDYQLFQASKQALEQTYDKAASDRDDLVRQVQAQKDYNEQIGLTAEEVLNLAAARREEQAARLDQKANTWDGLDDDVAARFRDQAKALRDLSVAEREGFVKERDPFVNMRISLNRYVEESKNAGGMIGDALTNAFRSAEDAFANFVTTGKLNFSDLAMSIIADLVRIQAKAAIGGVAQSLLGSVGTSTTSGWGGSLMQALGVSGARATGGPVDSGLSYLVGEKGPEIFTPSTSGTITPNHMIGAGAGQSLTIQTNVNIAAGNASSTTSGDQASAGRVLSDMINTKVKEVLTRESRQGGLIWKMQQGRA
jgi:phage-related minor tail protein